jgi:hypothetical protein
MKDNKIDIMCSKLGSMYTMLESANLRSATVDDVKKGIRQIQYDLELLRKCTLDNPDFKWSDELSKGYTQAKSEAFRNE